MPELKKADYCDEMSNRLEVLTIVYGSESGQKRGEKSGEPGFALRPSALMMLARKAFDSKHYAILTIRIPFDPMVARRAKRASAVGALNSREGHCVIRAIHREILSMIETRFNILLSF